MSTAPMVSVEGLGKEYCSPGAAQAVTVLQEVDLQLQAGEAVAIVGPSGSGKSTLLNILGTLDRPTRGRVRLDGVDLSGLDDATLAEVRNRKIGFVFQAHHLLPQCTVLENVLVPALADGRSGALEKAAQTARRLLDRVGLADRLEHRPGQLSGGERQRVAVVRALINQPQLLLADEPTGALDRETAARLGALLLKLNREEGVALLVVTHATDLARQMQRTLELRNGKLRPVALTT
jgi:lipoprotein-releasing system ATP-binding protein